MTDQQWQQAWEIYRSARELPDNERRSYVASISTDPEVFEQVILLIEEHAPQPSAQELKPGTTIGRYRVLGQLGRGGMGQVYSARDTELGRVLALKLLAPGLIATSPALDRLVREAKAASALNHPHIVTVYEVVRSGDEVAIAMELVEGHALRDYCGKPQPVAQATHWGRQIAQALAAAHEGNIVHRDIKPENLMVRPDGYVKVLDFGLARQLIPGDQSQSVSASGILAGTLNYMAPEQTRGEAASSASDVFSLGVVLYELVTGKHPFRSDSPIDTAHAILYTDPKPPSTLNRDIPSALSSLLLATLAKDPRGRPSAAELDQQLAAIEAGRFGKQFRGLRWLAVSGLTICLAGGLALWLLRERIFPPNEPTMTQLTTQASENRVTAAALSPDGKALAFATLGGSVHLRRMSDGFSQPLRTPAGLRVDRIAWFADGSRILVSGSARHQLGIWVMPISGGSPNLVVPDGTDGVPSPDGTRIAVTSWNGSIIWIVRVNGGTARQVRGGGATASFSSLTWSPDSKRIAYQRQEYIPLRDRQVNQNLTDREIQYQYSYESVDAATARVVASAKDVVMTSACGLPDGRVLFLRWISFARSRHYQVWELRTDPRSGRILSPPRRLTRNQYVTVSSISAPDDGREVAVVRLSEQPNVYIADLEPSSTVPRILSLRRLTFADAIEYPHAWTADNQTVIFESDRSGRFQLYRQNVGQTEPEPLTLTPSENRLPQLSPDGKWLLYRSSRLASPGEYGPDPGDGELMRVPVAGGTPQSVPINGRLDEFRCAIQPGTRCVLRSTENDQFVFHELDPIGGEGRELARTARSKTILGDWDLSPEGSQVAIPDHDPSQANIRLIALNARQPAMEERIISLRGLKNLNGVIWAADGRGWYVAVNTSHSLHHLLYADLQGRTSELDLESIAPMYAVPSPDGRHLAFPGHAASGNAWLVQGF